MKVQSRQNPYKSAVTFMPIILMLAVVPLIVRAKIVMLDENTAKFWTGNYQIDLFSYTKTRIIMLLTVWMLANAFFFFSKKDFKKLKESKWIFYPVIVFVFSLIVSTILSEHKDIAIWGAPERYEGMIVHLCYIIMFLYTYMTLKTEEDFKYIKYSILFLASAMAFIGLMQAFGKDILTMDFMRNVIVPKEYREMLSSVTTEGQNVYLTLQNSNYVGTYVSMIIPFIFMLCFSKNESKLIKGWMMIISLLTILILAKSHSRAGMFSLFIVALISVILFLKKLLKNKKIVLIMLIIIGFTFIIAENITNTWFSYNAKLIFNETKSIFMKSNSYIDKNSYDLSVYDIKVEGNRLILNTIVGIVEFSIKDNNYLIVNSNKENKLTIKDFTKTYALDNYLDGLSINLFKVDKNDVYLDILYNNKLYYKVKYNFSNNTWKTIDSNGKECEFINASHIGFSGKEKLGSGRGYIWSRTLPIILKQPFLGYGPDTFVTVFPQNDLPAKLYVYGSSNIITDKPHNMYLLYLINFGLVGFTSVCSIYIYYLMTFLKLYIINNRKDISNVACVALTIGYMLSGFFNDSLPVISPVFWIVLGSGVSLNEIVGKNYEI